MNVPKLLPTRRGLKSSRRRQRHGSTLLWTVLSMPIFSGVASLTFDMSRMRSAKGELQAAADAGALNACNGLYDGTYVAKAQAAAGENRCDGAAVALSAANVTVGNWTSPLFTANGTPSNAVRVIALRTSANGNPITATIANLIGRSAADVRATSIATLAGGPAYQWSSVSSTTVSASGVGMRLSAFDAVNPGNAETAMTLASNGSVSVGGKTTLNGGITYGTSQTVNSPATVSGTTQLAAATTYPTSASMVAKAGPVVANYGDQSINYNVTLGSGVYEVNNLTLTNCTLSFSGPTTLIVDGNVSMSGATLAAFNNLPANVKVIMNGGSGKTLSITNPPSPIYADFYAPDVAMTYASNNTTAGLRGRGLFKTMSLTTSATDKVYYDRSLTSAATHAVLVH